MKTLFMVPLIATAFLITGCMSSAITFVSSSVPLEQGRYTEIMSEVTGTSTQVNWLFFTFGAAGSGQRHALEDALSQTDGAEALVSMAVDEEYFMLVPFVLPSVYKTRVTGTPVKANAQ